MIFFGAPECPHDISDISDIFDIYWIYSTGADSRRFVARLANLIWMELQKQ